jgi:hypothetical protein
VQTARQGWNRHHAGITEAEERLLDKVGAIVEEHHPDAVARD